MDAENLERFKKNCSVTPYSDDYIVNIQTAGAFIGGYLHNKGREDTQIQRALEMIDEGLRFLRVLNREKIKEREYGKEESKI